MESASGGRAGWTVNRSRAKAGLSSTTRPHAFVSPFSSPLFAERNGSADALQEEAGRLRAEMQVLEALRIEERFFPPPPAPQVRSPSTLSSLRSACPHPHLFICPPSRVNGLRSHRPAPRPPRLRLSPPFLLGPTRVPRSARTQHNGLCQLIHRQLGRGRLPPPHLDSIRTSGA